MYEEPIEGKQIRQCWKDEGEIEPESEKKLELLEVKKNGSAKTFVYKDPEKENKYESLWTRIFKRKS